MPEYISYAVTFAVQPDADADDFETALGDFLLGQGAFDVEISRDVEIIQAASA
jgi:hypothetical protein